MIIIIEIGFLRKIPKGLIRGMEELGITENETRPSKLQHYWDRPEYDEDSWRFEESCHSDSS